MTAPSRPSAGPFSGNISWTAAGGPYQATSSLTVVNGATLTIEPGTTVFLGSGVNLTIANGGRLIAEGTAATPIRFTALPGSGTSWGGIVINGTVGSPEPRLSYVHFEGNGTTCIEVSGGTVYLDHATFGTTTHQYLALDNSSFLVSNRTFPTSTAPFELVPGTGGIKTGGRGIVRDCLFGTTTGYNDIMDFTGGNREQNQPIIQYYKNVFHIMLECWGGMIQKASENHGFWFDSDLRLTAPPVHRNYSPIPAHCWLDIVRWPEQQPAIKAYRAAVGRPDRLPIATVGS
jgi:hypothetical protein